MSDYLYTQMPKNVTLLLSQMAVIPQTHLNSPTSVIGPAAVLC